MALSPLTRQIRALEKRLPTFEHAETRRLAEFLVRTLKAVHVNERHANPEGAAAMRKHADDLAERLGKLLAKGKRK